jgi:hypothetical protein
MKDTNQDPLLREIVSGEELSGLRRASLEEGLRTLRIRERRRTVVRACLVSAAALVVAGGMLFQWRSWHSTPDNPGSKGAVATSGPAPGRVGEVKFITDDELLALFPDRPVALVGKPGRQQLVFLDVKRRESD